MAHINASLRKQLEQQCAALIAAGLAEHEVLACLGGDPTSDALLHGAMAAQLDASESSDSSCAVYSDHH